MKEDFTGMQDSNETMMTVPTASTSTSAQSLQSQRKPLSKGEELGRAALKSLGAPSFSPPVQSTARSVRPAPIPTASYSSQSTASTTSSFPSSSTSSFFFTSPSSESPISSTFASPAPSPAFAHGQASNLKMLAKPFSSNDHNLQASSSSLPSDHAQQPIEANGLEQQQRINDSKRSYNSLAISQQPRPELNHRFNFPFTFESSSMPLPSSSSTPARESFLRYSPRQTQAEWSRRSTGEDTEMDDLYERRPYSTETVSSDLTVRPSDETSTHPPLKGSESIRTLSDRRNHSIDEVSTQWFNPPVLPQPRGSLPSSMYNPSASFPASSTSPFLHQSSPILGASPRGRTLAPLPRRSPTPIIGSNSGMPAPPHSGQFVASPSPSLSDSIMRDASSSRSRSGSQASGLGLDYASFPQSPRRSFVEARNSHWERERGDRQVYGNNFGSFSGREPAWMSASDKRRWSADELVEAAQAKVEKLQASEDAEMREIDAASISPGKKRGSYARDGENSDRQSGEAVGRGSAPAPPTREEIMSRLQNKVKQRLAARSQAKKHGPTPSPLPSTPSSAGTSVSPSPRLAAESVSNADTATKYQYTDNGHSHDSSSLQGSFAAATSSSTSAPGNPKTRHGKFKMNSLPLPRPTTADREQRAALGIETLLNAAHAADQSE